MSGTAQTERRFEIGSLVRARGREWVVLPESKEDLLVLRPLGGTDDEVTGIYLPLETVEPAAFDLPDPEEIGDFRSCRLLRDALRFSSRAGAGPFRSFARIAVEPRPYQLVPLLLGLRQDPIRMFIADDVGIGKTIEACLLARELLDRGEIRRVAVLCPPHLAEQWQAELRDKFHIQAELVLPGTARRLEKPCGPNQSLFERYPFVVVSLDFIKSESRRHEFARACPEFVIVDEAHTCSSGFAGRGGRQQRHELLKALAADETRHLVLVSAVPHSGNEEAFRSLLSLLKPELGALPEDMSGKENAAERRRLAEHFVQRKRGDIARYLDAETPFPEREEAERSYQLHPDYKEFFEKVLAYAREQVQDRSGTARHQRIRWWSALALMRSLASSPAAAAATLRTRSSAGKGKTAEEVDEEGAESVLDVGDLEDMDGADTTPGADPTPEDEDGDAPRKVDRRLAALAREAESLRGTKDAKAQSAAAIVQDLLNDGFHPIVFCRFIPTAEYLAEVLRERLPKDVTVVPVTGLLPPADREARVAELGESHKRVLVCTDCLSEGINLQESFDSVVHYDLSWNPTRHEQRAGRVDRYGQASGTVRVLTYFGVDNRIDGVVLKVLIRKHCDIRKVLGVSVPVPAGSADVLRAITEGLMLSGGSVSENFLPGLGSTVAGLHKEWDKAADREKRSRTVFAQDSIRVQEVARELRESREATGSAEDVQRFTLEALGALKGVVRLYNQIHEIDLKDSPRALKDALGLADTKIRCRFELPVTPGVLHLARTHPVTENLSTYVMDTALDPQLEAIAARAGAIRTQAVKTRTTLLLVRLRYDLTTRRGKEGRTQLAEECRLLAFEGAPEQAAWLDSSQADALLEAVPSGNVLPDQAREFVRRVVDGYDCLKPRIEKEAHSRAQDLLEAHRRVREAARLAAVSYSVEPQLPADLLGVYIFLPEGGAAAGRTGR